MFKKLLKNEYLKNISTVATGTFLSQLVLILFIPILSRIYTPNEFGLYSLFIAFSSSIAIISTFTYERAIVLPKEKTESNFISILSIVICLFISAFTALILYIFNDFFLTYFGGLKFILILIPLKILQTGLQQIFDEILIRNKFYVALSSLRASNSLIVSTIQFISRFVYKIDGLIFGKFIGDLLILIAIIILNIRQKTINLKNCTFKSLMKVAKKNYLFPKFYLPQIGFNNISLNLPFIMLPYFYSLEIAGLYGMAIRILEQPIRLIATSTQSVYYQKASKMFSNKISFYNLYFETSKGLLKIFILPSFVILFFAPTLFAFFLGNQWYDAGVIAQLLIIWLIIGFIKTPSTMTFSIISKQEVQMYGELLLLILRFIGISAGYYIFGSYLLSICFYIIPSILIDLFFIFYINNQLKSFDEK